MTRPSCRAPEKQISLSRMKHGLLAHPLVISCELQAEAVSYQQQLGPAPTSWLATHLKPSALVSGVPPSALGFADPDKRRAGLPASRP